MGHPDGAHTHGGGGILDGLVPFAVVLGGAYVLAAVIGALIHLLIIVAVTVGAVFVAAIAGMVVVRLCLGTRPAAQNRLLVQRYQPPPRPVQARTAAPAIEVPRQNHIHFHGVSAADVAQILREQGGRP
jgi:hypothetical protein